MAAAACRLLLVLEERLGCWCRLTRARLALANTLPVHLPLMSHSTCSFLVEAMEEEFSLVISSSPLM